MKWSKTPASEVAATRAKVLLTALDCDNVEILQSAEILYRELMARGLEVLFDDRTLANEQKLRDAGRATQILLLQLGDGSLSAGELELILPRLDRVERVKLEDAVDKTLEKLNELKSV